MSIITQIFIGFKFPYNAAVDGVKKTCYNKF